MAAVVNICPQCFQTRIIGGVCPRCGFVPELEEEKPLALPYYFLLNRRYVTGRILGIGGFGITYIAMDAAENRLCCIKEYCPTAYVSQREPGGKLNCGSEEMRKEFAEGKEHFLAEADILDQLKNNISVVNAWESFEENDTAYYVMELLQGQNLRQYRKNHEPASVKAMALQMLLTMGNALGEIHRFGLLHGDISPENIIVTDKRDIKLIDFGTARAITQSVEGKDGKVYLKPSYAPPEMYSLDGKHGPWCDIYSLAATYYAVVSGTKMVDAKRRSEGEGYPSLFEMNIGISRELSDVIDHALTLDYHERYQSMMEFMQDVSRVMAESDLSDGMSEEGAGETQALSRNVLSEIKRKTIPYDELLKPKEPFGWLFKKKRTFQYLELLEGDRCVRRWNLPANREMSMGRLPDSDIMTPSHNMLSRRHCKITYRSASETFIVEDTKSTYGTYRENGERLKAGRQYSFKNGEKFYLFSPRFMFRVVIEK